MTEKVDYIPSEVKTIPKTTHFYFGTFVRKSYAINSNPLINIATMLVRDIVDEHNNYVRDHIWISGDIDKITKGLNLKEGDVVRFVGSQIVYRRGFVDCKCRYLGNVIATRGTTVKYLDKMANVSRCGKTSFKRVLVPERYIKMVEEHRKKNGKFVPAVWRENETSIS